MAIKLKAVFLWISKNISTLFFIFLILLFFYTGKFNILKDRIEAWMGKDQGLKIADMTFNFIPSNQQINLSQLKGKVVLINFWATWCPPCRIEIPSLMELYGKYKPQGLEIIGVSIDSAGQTPVITFIKDKKINYPVVMANQDILKNFDPVIAVPTTYLLDKNGIVVRKFSGFYLKSSFENEIKKLLDSN
jgi:thiol-disulfide isomerase/thioredoxin